MSNQLVPVFQQYFNADGDAEAGLVLHTYIAGTLNDKETFQTYAGTANTNPIIMNASGYPPAGIYGTGTYRFILKDSEGTTLRDQDNVVLTEGLQPDADGNYVIPSNLDIQGTLTINGVIITGDGNGNIAYNGATIPATLNSLYNYTFHTNNSCTMKFKSNGDTIECANMYEDGTNWVSIAAGESSRVEDQEIQNLRYVTTVATGGAGSTATAPGQVLTTALVYQQMLSTGNINILTGGTYTSTL